MTMPEWFTDPEKIGIITLLFGAVVGFMKGWIVPGPTHDRVVKERDKYLDMATRGMELALRTTDERIAVVKERTP
jgi:hypothetical protein